MRSPLYLKSNFIFVEFWSLAQQLGSYPLSVGLRKNEQFSCSAFWNKNCRSGRAFWVIVFLLWLREGGKRDEKIPLILFLMLFPFIQHSDELTRFYEEAWASAPDHSAAATLFISCTPWKNGTVKCSIYNFSVKHLCTRPCSLTLSNPATMSTCGRALVSSKLALCTHPWGLAGGSVHSCYGGNGVLALVSWLGEAWSGWS